MMRLTIGRSTSKARAHLMKPMHVCCQCTEMSGAESAGSSIADFGLDGGFGLGGASSSVAA